MWHCRSRKNHSSQPFHQNPCRKAEPQPLRNSGKLSPADQTGTSQQQGFFKGDYKNKDGYVFTWEDGTPYRPDYISSTFKKAATAFGRPEITLHKLRHTCASLLINKGWDVKRLQYWLGQTDTQTTLNIYAHFDKHRLNAGENDLSQIALAAADLFEEHFG